MTALDQPDDNTERARVLALLRRHGWNATSFQVLEPGFRYWFSGDACVAYVDTGAAWVVAGAPICAEPDLDPLARRFAESARESGRDVVFFATERRFAPLGFENLLIGTQPVFDPRVWADALRGSPGLREQLRRARAKGVRVRAVAPWEVSDPGAPARREIEGLVGAWLLAKPLPEMGFLVRVDPFDFPEERRFFVAERADGPGARVVGFAAMVPVYARGGWFIEDLIRAPDAPNGTAELLVDAAMNEARAHGSSYLTLGLAPLAGPIEADASLPAPLRLVRRHTSRLYDFAGLERFKAKFRPAAWAPIYLSYPAQGSAARAIYHSLVAFSRRGLLRYGLETLLRGPSVVLRGLGVLLVPWSLLLASVDSERWFPSPLVHWAWVVFDLLLCVALLRLSREHESRSSRLVLGALCADVVLTTWQALAFNAARVRGAADAALVLLAVAAPAFALVILWGAQRRALRVTRARRADARDGARASAP